MRRQARAARKALSQSARRKKADRAAQHLLRSPILRRARTIAAYLHTGSEIETTSLIDGLLRRGRRVLVPLIDRRIAGRMSFVRLRAGTALVEKRYGICAPARSAYAPERVDLVVLPLTAFDAHGNRLGNGGGYYDRWLARQRPRPLCIGYAYSVQEVGAVPVDAWDQRLDAVCTERGLRRFSSGGSTPH
ncbi:MAG: 5-formyltetrahydrofolate cyclo-ligase [Panacagrimonas sp.]